jgi:hypothetical protein
VTSGQQHLSSCPNQGLARLAFRSCAAWLE